MGISNCCGALIVPESIDVCSDCGEHCEVLKDLEMADEIQVGDVVKYSNVIIKGFSNITENHHYLVQEVLGGFLIILGDNFTESAYSKSYFSKAKIKPSEKAIVGDLVISIRSSVHQRKIGQVHSIRAIRPRGRFKYSEHGLCFPKGNLLVIDQRAKYSIAKLYERI